jgi:hypothetical protein
VTSTRSAIENPIVESNPKPCTAYTVNKRHSPINPTTTMTPRSMPGDSRRP